MHYLVAWVPGHRHRHFSLLARNNVFPLKKDVKEEGILKRKEKPAAGFQAGLQHRGRIILGPGCFTVEQ